MSEAISKLSQGTKGLGCSACLMGLPIKTAWSAKQHEMHLALVTCTNRNLHINHSSFLLSLASCQGNEGGKNLVMTMQRIAWGHFICHRFACLSLFCVPSSVTLETSSQGWTIRNCSTRLQVLRNVLFSFGEECSLKSELVLPESKLWFPHTGNYCIATMCKERRGRRQLVTFCSLPFGMWVECVCFVSF